MRRCRCRSARSARDECRPARCPGPGSRCPRRSRRDAATLPFGQRLSRGRETALGQRAGLVSHLAVPFFHEQSQLAVAHQRHGFHHDLRRGLLALLSRAFQIIENLQGESKCRRLAGHDRGHVHLLLVAGTYSAAYIATYNTQRILLQPYSTQTSTEAAGDTGRNAGRVLKTRGCAWWATLELNHDGYLPRTCSFAGTTLCQFV